MKQTKEFAFLTVIALVCYTNVARADDATLTRDNGYTYNNTNNSSLYDLYRAQEVSVDAFGVGTIGQQTIDHISGNRILHNGRAGAGLGVNYFFCRYLGIGADAYAENTTGPFIDSASGNLIARLPIGNTGLAPYIFGGGGYQFEEVKQGFGQAGAGLEFRFCRNVGLFADARYVITDHKTENYGVGRAGLRIAF
jgi:hypothetical protein